MKLKLLKFIIPCVASLACLSGCGENGDYKPTEEQKKEIASYYAKYDLEKEGGYLLEELQKLCFKTHTVYVKYKSYSTYASFATDHISSEAVPGTVKYKKDGTVDFTNSKKSGKNEYFYTGKTASGVGTREHVWPCANSDQLWVHESSAGSHYVDGSTYKGGGSDLYHVRPSTPAVNTARGNSKFVDFDDDEFEQLRDTIVEYGDKGPYKLKLQGGQSNKTPPEFADKVEVDDHYKGDVARILVYVWVHYGNHGNFDFISDTKKDMIGDLDLCSVLGYGPNRERVFEKLCEWNNMDPPSSTEKLRNDTVQKLQGNRNPFVDHPELMEQLLLEMI